jgi:hypothetical protein
MSWHADAGLLESYARGSVDEAAAFSLEAHLVVCALCRERAGSLVEPARLELVWDGVQELVDAPRPGPVERLLVRLGVPEHVARVLAATPSLSLSWLLAVGFALAFAVMAAHQGERGLVVFLALAPLLPLAGVSVSYGPGIDPTYEIGLASPLRSFRLLLIRATAVFASTIALAGVAALTLPELDARVAAWLLPALGLTVMSLALATRLAPLRASTSLALAWIAAVTVSAQATHDRFAAFRPPVQLAFAVVTVGAALVIARRREAFETGREL